MANGKPIKTPEKLLASIRKACESKGYTLTTTSKVVYSDLFPKRYLTAVIMGPKKPVGILIRSQTKKGTTGNKLALDALSLKTNKTMKCKLVVIGTGWNDKVVKAIDEHIFPVLTEENVIDSIQYL